MMSSQRMEVTHGSHVGQVRRQVLETAQRLGSDEVRAGEAAIVASELATNLVKHGGGGEIVLLETREPSNALELLALDQGPGMANISNCLRDGYSTAGSAGTGLGAVQRLAGTFQIHSQPGKGTAIWVSLGTDSGPAVPPRFECSGVSLPLRGQESCGDSWDHARVGHKVRVLVADGLGHGPFAEAASREAVSIFRKNLTTPPALTLKLMHEALMKTRGAAGSMVEIDPDKGTLTMAGIGNVLMRLHGPNGSKTLTVDNGTLGAAVRRMNETVLPWTRDSVLVIYSDGLGSQWDLHDYPGLIRRHPGLVSGVLYRDFRRPHDDASVIVIRETQA